MFSSLSESGFIPTPDSIQFNLYSIIKFSSLSESGFIPTVRQDGRRPDERATGSHLFQRVASFLLKSKEMLEQFKKGLFSSLSESGFIPTVIGPKDKGKKPVKFSSLSESGFIPTL